MTDPEVLQRGLQTLRSGVAIADPETLVISFENATFFQWFPPSGDDHDTLASRLPTLDKDRLRKRAERGRPYTLDVEIKRGARDVSIGIEIQCQEVDGRKVLVLEGLDTTKQKEAQYMLESYARLAERNAREVQKEKERVEKLLLNVMPRSVYEELKDYGSTTPQRFDSASVLMLDFVGFTEMAISQDPSAIVAELNDIFSAFDRIVELFGCERIKTIGDAYVAVSGLPEANQEHAISIAKAAMRMRRYVERRNASHPTQWQCRIGIATGSLIGSLVGIQKYVYDIFGPAVNYAARMEQAAEPMQIAISGATMELIEDDFVIDELGEFDLKGFGRQPVYALVDELAQPCRPGLAESMRSRLMPSDI